MRFRFLPDERRELAKAWLAVSLAFAILFGGGFAAIFSAQILLLLVVAAFTVGLGFLLHELAHKYVANSYGCHAEFRAENSMLLIALVTSLFNFVIAAPGAVHISGHPSHEQRGVIALAGPTANLVLSLAFLLLYIAVPGDLVVLGVGYYVNAVLGLFNLIPFGFFDGAKILAWSRGAFAAAVVAAVLLVLPAARLGVFA